jgi:hypothetical protein
VSAASRRYSLVLPPGFVLIPVQGDVEATVRTVVKEHYGDVTNDRTRGRIRRLERSLVSAVAAAKEQGVVDVVLPLGVPWQVPVSLSLAFAPARSGAAPEASPGSTTVPTRGGEARREVIDHDAGTRPEIEIDLPGDSPGGALRTVHHVWAAPTPGVDHLVGTFTVSGSDDPDLAPMVDALTELGDTIMASLRWRGADAPAAADTVSDVETAGGDA